MTEENVVTKVSDCFLVVPVLRRDRVATTVEVIVVDEVEKRRCKDGQQRTVTLPESCNEN